MSRRNEIMLESVGLDYERFSRGPLAFDYEGMMAEAGYSLEEVKRIQAETGVGRTPLLELRNVTELVRRTSPPGKGATILLKDEACNPSGSFKARRASVSVYHAAKRGYRGVVAGTSGNYGAAVASQAAARGLACIVVQEAYDSSGTGQPEIMEKARACEAYGAEVIQLSVGPELFYVCLRLLEETGYFNASLYTPYGIAGIETLGAEIADQVLERYGRHPDAVCVTHAGGGNVTGTARGLAKAGAGRTRIIGVSVDLSGLHMASDRDFNRKSFTTGHTGFGFPFATWPDRSDVPRNAARPLRYMDRYVTVTQGEVFYATEMLAALEGLERGPAGNTSLAAAMAVAREMDEDQVLVVQETEYTGAGKHPSAQLTFARRNGVEVRRGHPSENVPGKTIVIPEHPGQVSVNDVDLNRLRASLVRNAIEHSGSKRLNWEEVRFLADETKSSEEFVLALLRDLDVDVADEPA
ncbi:MAG: 2-amino-4-oxopentanoate thiolase subunit OrtB, partial [Firmicutes bacterium]|nr:2-amino-4-oxopentanoate thiolase subunit OrtB [Bacillota bacterium]